MEYVAERILKRKNKTPESNLLERKFDRVTDRSNELLETDPELNRSWEIELTNYLSARTSKDFLFQVRVVTKISEHKNEVVEAGEYIVTGYLLQKVGPKELKDDFVIYKVEVIDNQITSVKTVDNIDVSCVVKLKDAQKNIDSYYEDLNTY